MKVTYLQKEGYRYGSALTNQKKIVEIGKIVNQNIFKHEYKYESIYDNPKTSPGIF